MIELFSLSVVVPVYNSESSLPLLLQRLQPVLDRCASASEVIFVNDGSFDHSWDVIRELSQRSPNVRGINLMRNYGQHNALLCGIRAAQHDIIVTLDDDLQHPPEEIPRLLDALAEGYDVIYGTPRQAQHSLQRNIASRLTKLALRTAMGIPIADKTSAFRAFRTPLREAFSSYTSPYVVIDVLLTWGTTKFTSVAVNHDPRPIGRSNYTLRKLISHFVNMVTGFSTVPLKLASWLGFLFTVFGMAVLIYVIGRLAILGYSAPGFPFLASIIAIFSGIQLFIIGVFGKYLARIHMQSMGRPSLVVREHIGWPDQEDVDDK